MQLYMGNAEQAHK